MSEHLRSVTLVLYDGLAITHTTSLLSKLSLKINRLKEKSWNGRVLLHSHTTAQIFNIYTRRTELQFSCDNEPVFRQLRNGNIFFASTSSQFHEIDQRTGAIINDWATSSTSRNVYSPCELFTGDVLVTDGHTLFKLHRISGETEIMKQDFSCFSILELEDTHNILFMNAFNLSIMDHTLTQVIRSTRSRLYSGHPVQTSKDTIVFESGSELYSTNINTTEYAEIWLDRNLGRISRIIKMPSGICLLTQARTTLDMIDIPGEVVVLDRYGSLYTDDLGRFNQEIAGVVSEIRSEVVGYEKGDGIYELDAATGNTCCICKLDDNRKERLKLFLYG